MLEVLLVFSINAKEPPEISDRIFYSYDECAEFVNTLAGQEVVNSDYGFRFIATDGVLFEGQCIDQREYFLKTGKFTI